MCEELGRVPKKGGRALPTFALRSRTLHPRVDKHMPLHLLGWVATALLAGHVCVRPEARQLATALLLAGLASLLAAWHVAYAGAACVVAAVAAAQRWVAPGSLALGAAFHVVAAWCLPVVTAWGVTMQFGDGLFSQEVGHLLPTTFEFAVLFLLPVVMVLAHPEEPLRLRQAESLAMLLAGFIDGCIESASIAHREACCKTREWAPSVCRLRWGRRVIT